MRCLYICKSCGQEQEPILLTDWQCASCGCMRRTKNEKPEGWEAFQDNQGHIVSFCEGCSREWLFMPGRPHPSP